jgi:tRNA-(ms[2]io[6]A)-hydroxylase
MAMHLVSHYRDRQTLIDAMVEFACEELDHFRQVYGLIRARGLVLQRDEKDAYVNRLNALLDRGSHGYFLDRLLVAGIIEARGCERFAILAGALDDPELARFYREIAAAEARHRGLFLDLAREYFDDTRIRARLDWLLDAEAEIVAGLPHRAALH